MNLIFSAKDNARCLLCRMCGSSQSNACGSPQTIERLSCSWIFSNFEGSTSCNIMTKSCIHLLSGPVGRTHLSVSPSQAHAQDPELQFYANPMLLNPAFAGTARGPRVVLATGTSGPLRAATMKPKPSATTNTSGRQRGVGLSILNDQQGVNTFGTTRLTVLRHQQSISREVSLRMGLEASYRQRSLDWGGLSFGT